VLEQLGNTTYHRRMADRFADRVTVPDVVGLPFHIAQDMAADAGVALANTDPDGPPISGLAWPGLFYIGQRVPQLIRFGVPRPSGTDRWRCGQGFLPESWPAGGDKVPLDVVQQGARELDVPPIASRHPRDGIGAIS